MSSHPDVVIIGAGIVGLATAYTLQRRFPGIVVEVIEKEPVVAAHQSGRNSGVIHAGVYYAPGSLKARLCRTGALATRRFCTEHAIPHATPGKLVVATTPAEVQRLGALAERARANGLDVQQVPAGRLRELEPRVAGLEALLVPGTGITDYAALCRALVAEITRRDGRVSTGARVVGVRDCGVGVHVEVSRRRGDAQPWQEVVRARRVVACAGLQADRIAAMAGADVADLTVVPFRGEYFRLHPRRSGVVSHLIYPVPDPALPFLGVHLTRTVEGGVTVGPNAVLGLAREGYRRTRVAPRDLAAYLGSAGFWHLARDQWRTGIAEQRDSLWRRGYLRRVQRYCPEITLPDLLPEPPGIRAQLVTRQGGLVEDFLTRRTRRTVHLLNAPSPAATSALPIAEHLVDLLDLSAPGDG